MRGPDFDFKKKKSIFTGCMLLGMDGKELYELFLRCGRRIGTDSRSIAGGELFVALKGENFDGDRYALQALRNGAACALVSRRWMEENEAGAVADEDFSALRNRLYPVEDTLEALWELARQHRFALAGGSLEGPLSTLPHLCVLGLTGTNGKTTTKELLRAVLGTRYRVCATAGNLNNNIGVPLTLLSIPEDCEIAIVEMGASHPGDIQTLVKVCCPDCGLITNVGKAHLLGFGSFEGVQRTKGELYDWLYDHGGLAFVNRANPFLSAMAGSRPGLRTVGYSAAGLGLGVLTGAESLAGTGADESVLYLKMDTPWGRLDSHLVGAYNADNIATALAVGQFFGVDMVQAVRTVAAYEPANKRSQMQCTQRNRLILDAYNANPSSMAAALDNFAVLPAPPSSGEAEPGKAVLLGDMRELGEDALAEHVALLERLVALKDTQVFLVGEEFGRALAARPCLLPDARHFADAPALRDYLLDHPLSGRLILIKGSRGIAMEQVLPAL